MALSLRNQRPLKLAAAAGLLLSLVFQANEQAIGQAPNELESQMVAINFEAVVGDEPFSCGETYQIGTADSTVTPLDFRLYVSEVALMDADGNAVPVVLQQDGRWQHQNVALLDFEDKTGGCINGTTETRAQVVGAVPAGDYSGLRFTVGVPFALNHIDSTLAPSPLNLTSLWWNWNFGYKFMRLDFETNMETAMSSTSVQSSVQSSVQKSEGHSAEGHSEHGEHAASRAFAIHLGSVGCQMDTSQAPVRCTSPHQAEVFLPGFDLEQDVVVADVSALLADTNLAENQEGTPVGCMSNPQDADCGGIMQNIGLPFPNQPVSEQTFFSIK